MWRLLASVNAAGASPGYFQPMPRYFFNVRDRYGFTPDREGVELANTATARE